MFRTLLILLVVCAASTSAPSFAQSNDAPDEDLLPGSKGLEKEPEPEPLPDRPEPEEEEVENTPEPVEPEERSAPPQPIDTRPKRGAFDGSMLLGPAAVSMPGTDTETGFAPALMLGHKSAFLFSNQVGMRWSTRYVLHDFEAVGSYYGWYNEGTREEVQTKYLLLWPGLIFGPFVGANYGTGLGFVVYTSPRNPALYFDAGIGFDLWLNPSDSDFIIDVGLSTDFTIGIDFNEVVGLGATLSWGFPFFRGLFDSENADIPTLIFYLSIL